MTKATTRPMVRIHDLATDEIIDREMNDAEFAEHKARQKAIAETEATKANTEANKAAILERLGLTEDELKTILG